MYIFDVFAFMTANKDNTLGGENVLGEMSALETSTGFEMFTPLPKNTVEPFSKSISLHLKRIIRKACEHFQIVSAVNQNFFFF